MDWIPIVFATFKLLVLGTGMFYAIKWHYDQGKKDKQQREQETRALLRTSGKVAAGFMLSLLVLGGVTFELASALGLELSFP